MTISRRKFLAGVAATATVAVLPALKVTRSVGPLTYELYPYQRDAIERITAAGRQLGKSRSVSAVWNDTALGKHFRISELAASLHEELQPTLRFRKFCDVKD